MGGVWRDAFSAQGGEVDDVHGVDSTDEMLQRVAYRHSLSAHPSARQSLDELFRKAAQERVVNFYGTLAQVNAEKILPVFEKRFPGIKVNHVDITSDNLVARAVAEARGGKTLGDIFQAPLETALQMHDQKLLLEVTLAGVLRLPGNYERFVLGCVESAVYRVAWNTICSRRPTSRSGSMT